MRKATVLAFIFSNAECSSLRGGERGGEERGEDGRGRDRGGDGRGRERGGRRGREGIGRWNRNLRNRCVVNEKSHEATVVWFPIHLEAPIVCTRLHDCLAQVHSSSFC